MRGGAYGPQRLTFVQQDVPKLATFVDDRLERFDREVYTEYARVPREQPFYRAPEVSSWLRNLVARPEFNDIFNLREDYGA